MTRYEPGSLIRRAMSLYECQGKEIQALSTPYLIKHDLVFAWENDFGRVESIVVVDIITNPMSPRLKHAGIFIGDYFSYAN